VADLDPERWQRLLVAVDAAFGQAPTLRPSHLERLRAIDPALHAEVEAILAADAALGGVLERRSEPGRERFFDSLRGRSTASLRQGADATLELQELVRDVLGEMAAEPARLGAKPFASEPAEGGRFLPGVVLAGRYRIVSRVGRGGFGEVYRADDLTLGQTVALKFIPPELERDPSHLARLLNEVRLARQISHPNVCRVFDVGEADGHRFISMEFVDGEDLASLLRRIGRIPRSKAVQIAQQLCAGLAAAHDQGILHRDLKPGNIMLDGRGRVRIADFGLAVAGTVVRGPHARAGTPAYQAPEQIDGREASVRSDLYALGLVLYEAFTGRRAFHAESLAELRAQQAQATPQNPSALVEGIDPAVERAILSCLHRDPAARPASALAIAAALPGGDPLAVALAAGETPSPEMVAAAGSRGVLTPRTAALLLGGLLVLQGVIVALSDRTSLLGGMPSTKSAEVLEENAREILRQLGHDLTATDSSTRIAVTNYYERSINLLGANREDPDRWRAFRQPGELAIGFQYRQSRWLMLPTGRDGRVQGGDDPPTQPGDATVITNLRGRLMQLRVMPPRFDPSAGPAPPVQWEPLLAAAGLDSRQLEPVPPVFTPPVFAEVRSSWVGTLHEFGDLWARIDAAAYRGRPVYFYVEILSGPRTEMGRGPDAPSRSPWEPRVRSVVMLAVLLSVGAVAAWLALENWRRGRADRIGALRVAAAILVLHLAGWVLGGHHVPDPMSEAVLLMRALSNALLAGCLAWALYIALEPQVRRYPARVIAWTRLLQGRFRDPLVGRDLLIGAVVGSAVFICGQQLRVALPEGLGIAGPPPAIYPAPAWVGEPPSLVMLGGRHLAAELVLGPTAALSLVFTLIVLLTGLRWILRRDWLALGAFIVILTLAAPPFHLGGYSAASILASLAAAVAWGWMISRMGVLSSVGGLWSWGIYQAFPITGNIHAPHLGTGLVGLLAILAFAAYGAYTASAVRLRPV